ncbi:hypothetical protein AGMMS49942_09250 [Spirochaetia bacterium]|nr:hypothetical protein AGMMS49942_09250 [Spirochaetia bacterium]
MSNTELLLKEIEKLPPDYVGEVLDFVGYLNDKVPLAQSLEYSRLKDVKKYPSLAAMRGCCKGLDTMDEYFERKRVDKEKEEQQKRQYS